MSRINQALHQMKLQDWALKIKDQASSGLLVSEWCAQNHVTRYQLHYWKRLVKEAAIEQMLPEIVPLPLSTPDTDSSHTGFPCRATSASSAASSCDEPAHSSVSLKVNGISLELDPSTPTDFLIKLMKAVSQC